MKTKILTKFQLCILSISYFTAISCIYQLYIVLTKKSSSCEHRPSKNGHNCKSLNDTAMKFSQNL